MITLSFNQDPEYLEGMIKARENAIDGQHAMIEARNDTIRELNRKLIVQRSKVITACVLTFIAGVIVGWFV